MSISNTFHWANLVKPHGFSGQIFLALLEPGKWKIKKMSAVFIDFNGNLVPFFVEKIQLQSNSAIIKLEGVDTEDEARKMMGKSLFLDNSYKPKKISSHGFDELSGFQVWDRNEGMLGIIKEIEEYPQQFIAVMSYKNQEILFPLNEFVIIGVDQIKKVLEVNLPEGLLDVYL